jgi:hypothetical protein
MLEMNIKRNSQSRNPVCSKIIQHLAGMNIRCLYSEFLPFNFLKLAILIAALICIYGNGRAQNKGLISGKVTEASTGKPAPFINVYFANTSIGTTSNENGEFVLKNIPNGKYSLTFSGVGYKLKSSPIEILDKVITGLEISIDQEIILLREVVVQSKKKDFAMNFLTFKKYFLGESSNANECSITNADAINFDYDKNNDLISATSQEPIEIINRALGYKVLYTLQTFLFDRRNNLVTFNGIPRFENLEAKNKNEEKKWKRKRDRSYNGSITHFISSWYSHSTKENGFLVWKLDSDNQEQLINPDSLFERGSNNIINFQGSLKVVFAKEREEVSYRNDDTSFIPQTSILVFKKKLKIYSNGYYENSLNLVLNGYMGWEKIAELVPLEYKN